jgi:Na+-transporting NADH:ubiquinone oxidoreductase subunit B
MAKIVTRAQKKPLIKKQKVMITVLKALAPVAMGAIYFYGWRALAVLAICNAACFASEYWFTSRRGEPVTMAVFVTGSLLALSLPPNIPFWICIVGSVAAIVFGKELFGGFGRNVFNPALVGRAFIFVNFPIAMTGTWHAPIKGAAGGLTAWSSADAITGATPLQMLAEGESYPLWNLVSGASPGSLGEGASLLIILAGVYLVYTKAASLNIILSTLLTYLVSTLVCWFMGWGTAINPVYGLFSGALLYGAVFMATDPVSAVASREGKIVYGAIIGLTAMLIRNFGNFPEGVMFAILMGNTFGPIAEIGIKQLKAKPTPKGQSE